MKKYIFVTGGVVSGLGKGIVAASLGRLLKDRGYKVLSQKLDPYINIDPGTMSPYQHGEVYVTEDGAETDLDLGHYERFIDEDLNKYSNLTTGKVYWNVMNKERNGEYLGSTVQVIPHITDEIKEFIYNVGKMDDADIIISEIGGTIGDIESQPFLEAIRQVAIEVGKENCVFIHVTLVPYMVSSGEHKSKPTQHSVKEMRYAGLQPDVIVMRSNEIIGQEIKDKISMFCDVPKDCVFENLTIDSIYEVPLMLEKSNFSSIICRELNLEPNVCRNEKWKEMVCNIKSVTKEVNIALVGKYVQLHDAYLSVMEALRHAGYAYHAKVNIEWIDSETITDENINAIFQDIDGILIPGGFGNRGIEGKILAARYARENNIPYLGICLGMQIAVIEYARNVMGMSDANSTEFSEKCKYNVIDFMPDQNNEIPKGGTMRLGAYKCLIRDNTMLEQIYGTNEIKERHRHRYEFNNDYREKFEEAGLIISGTSPDNKFVEAIEIQDNDYFVAVQYHPEFKSRPNKPHPVFMGLIEHSIKE